MLSHVEINARIIGDDNPAYIVAEASCNHNGCVSTGKKIIEEAKRCGADAVKFQNYLADDFVCKENRMYKIFKKVEQQKEFFDELFRHACEIGITMFSTAASIQAADEIYQIGMPAVKLGSSNINNFPLLEHVSQHEIPVIFSSGHSTFEEIDDAVSFFKQKEKQNIIIMHCVAEYPARIEDVNVSVIQEYRKRYRCPIGFSDHTLGMNASVAAVCQGASIIEKHFTLDNNMEGPDHGFSITPVGLKKLVITIRDVEKAIGTPVKKITAKESEARDTVRRCVVAKKDIMKGMVITKNMLTIKRPGKIVGLPPKFLKQIIGCVAKRTIKSDESILNEMIYK